MVALWPIATTGFVWLNETVVEFNVVELTFIIPQLVMSVVQTVIDAAPVVLVAVSVTTEPPKAD